MRLSDRPAGSSLRVLHLPWNIAGHAAGLAFAEREIGLDSRSIELEPGAFGITADELISPPRRSALARERARWGLLARALREADVVHYNWGDALFTPPPPNYGSQLAGPLRSRLAMSAAAASRALVPFRDLKALRKAGKVIAVTFQGDDVRQGDRLLNRHAHSLANMAELDYYSPATDHWKRRKIAAFERYADLIYALNPDLLHDLPQRARFLAYASVNPRQYVAVASSNARPVIVHAPSDRRVKGTDQIIAAVGKLRSAGRDVELDLVENIPHAEALKRYARADIFIDQLNAGFYGGVAVEAMALGKPVLAWLREDDLTFLPPAMRTALPVVNVAPGDLAATLARLLDEGSATLGRRGKEGRAFVEAWHDPRVIAAALKRDYEAALSRFSR